MDAQVRGEPLPGSPRWWNPERTDMLTSMRAAGMSSTLIADELGTTRNAVLGKSNRLGLPSKLPTDQPTKPRRPHKARGQSGGEASKLSHRLRTRTRIIKNEVMQVSEPTSEPDWRVAQRLDVEETPLAQRRTILGLTDDTCRWPCGDPCKPDFFFVQL